jgi:hypothetical protein
MDCEFRALAVLAEVRMNTSPKALEVATAVLFDAPDEDVESEVVPSRAAAAADAAFPEEKDVVITRACRSSANAVTFVKLFLPDCDVESESVVMFLGAVGLMDVNCVLYGLPSAYLAVHETRVPDLAMSGIWTW